MKVRLKTNLRGTKVTKSYGEIIDVNESFGRYLIDNKQAELILGVVETSMIEPSEKAVMPKARAKRG